jgi:hypothetical protein
MEQDKLFNLITNQTQVGLEQAEIIYHIGSKAFRENFPNPGTAPICPATGKEVRTCRLFPSCRTGASKKKARPWRSLLFNIPG